MAEEWHVKLGHQQGDTGLRAAPKLQWSLQPLPLPAFSPAFKSQMSQGFLPSLSSLCLTVISRNLPLYGPESFEGVPAPLVRKIFIRAGNDRGHDHVGEQARKPCPDKTSLWALETMVLLSNDAKGSDIRPHLCILPTDALVYSLNVATSPLRRLVPALPLTHCTSLSLLNAREALNDETCISLRHLPSLTVLSLSGTSIADVGLRKLASALDVDTDGTKRGMWALKALYLHRCGGVSDKGISALARFGGLCILDIRNTSCTDVAVALLNRQVRKLYPSQAPFSATDPEKRTAARDMFSQYAADDTKVLSVLAMAGVSSPKDRVRLHLHGTKDEIPQEQWPFKAATAKTEGKAAKGVYRDSGIGNLYGADAAFVQNPSAVAEAERLERARRAYDDGGNDELLEKPRKRRRKRVDPFRLEAGELGVHNPRLRAAWAPASASARDPTQQLALGAGAQLWLTYLQLARADGANVATVTGIPVTQGFAPRASHLYPTPTERSKAFVAPPSTAPKRTLEVRRAQAQETEVINGAAFLMLSREVPDDWELPRVSDAALVSHAESLRREREAPVQLRKRQSTGVLPSVSGGSSVELLLGALDARVITPTSTSATRPVPSSQGSSQSSSQESRPSQTRRPSSPPTRSISGLGFSRQRASSPGIVPAPLLPHGVLPTPDTSILPARPAPFRLVAATAAARNPFPTATPKTTNAAGVVSLGFDTPAATKRKWGAGVAADDKKRRGMLMFGGGVKPRRP